MTTATLLHDTGEVQLLHRPGRTDFTLIMFGEGMGQGGEMRWRGQALAERLDLDVLAFSAARPARFPGLAVDALLPIAHQAGKPRRLTLGQATGGFAALRYAAALEARAVVALSPHAPPDRVGLSGGGFALPGHRDADPPPGALIGFDPSRPTDAAEARTLAALPGVRLVPLAGTGPDLLRILAGAEQIETLFRLALDGQVEDAARCLHRMRRHAPQVWLDLGLAAELAGRSARAECLIGQARRLGARPKAIQHARLQAATQAKRPDIAANALRQLRRLDPEARRIPVWLGQQLLAAGKPTEAILAFREAVARQADDLPAHLGLIDALERRGTPKPAVAAAEAAIVALPGSALLRARLGRALLAAGRQAEAVTALRQALATDPALREARSLLGRIEGTPASPIRALEAAVDLAPQDEAAQLRLIDALAQRKQAARALIAARAAVAALPGSAECQARLGHLALRQDPEAAAAALSAAIAAGQSDAATMLALSHALARLDRAAEALDAAREAARAHPSSSVCQARLGQMATEPAEAEAALRAAIALDHPGEQVGRSLIHLLRQQGRLDEAVLAAREAAARFPDQPDAQVRVGDMLMLAEDCHAAEVAFRAALAMDGEHAAAQLGLGEALRVQKRIKEAVAAFRRGEALGGDPRLVRVYRYRLFGELE